MRARRRGMAAPTQPLRTRCARAADVVTRAMSRSTMLKNLIRGCACVLFAIVAASAVLPAMAASPASGPAAKRPMVVGFVYVTPIGEAGWTFQHELGRREMARALGAAVRTIAVESVGRG